MCEFMFKRILRMVFKARVVLSFELSL
jgi:hypothetical protein